MSAWLVFSIVAILFLFAEIYTMTMFFLNFSAAAIVCVFLSLGTENYNILIPIFSVLSILFILFLRPFLNINPKREKIYSFESQYIGKKATAETEITAFSGRLSIYDENWEARTLNEKAPVIKKGAKVTIVHHDDLTMFVEQKGKN